MIGRNKWLITNFPAGGKKTIPQIFIDYYHVGGNDELQALEREGKLDDILKS